MPQVNRIMGRMDTVVAKLKTRESKLTENMDMLHRSEAHEGHLVTVQVSVNPSQILLLQRILALIKNQNLLPGSSGCSAGSPEGA